MHPTNDAREKQSLGVAQLEAKGVWVITPLAQNVCEVTYVTNIVDKGERASLVKDEKISRAIL